MIWLAGVTFGLCCWALLGRGPSVRAQFMLQGHPIRRQRAGWLRWAMLVTAIATFAFLAPRLLVFVVPALIAVSTASWLFAQARSERQRRANSAKVVQACQAVAAQLRIGDIPAKALSRVAVDSPLLASVAATQAIGGDVPAALQAASQRPGCSGLAGLSRAWQLCQLSGAPVAQAATQVAEGLRAEAAAERLVAAELAAPKASGRLLAGLPALGIGMAFAAGGNPITFLTATLIGQLCLAVASCLVCAGLVWTTRLGRLPRLDDEAP